MYICICVCVVCNPGHRVSRPRPLAFGGCAFPPVSLGPAGDCPCRRGTGPVGDSVGEGAIARSTHCADAFRCHNQ